MGTSIAYGRAAPRPGWLRCDSEEGSGRKGNRRERQRTERKGLELGKQFEMRKVIGWF